MDKKGQGPFYIPIHFGREATTFSKEKGLWLVANVDQNIGWPQKRVMVIYRCQKILLLPASKKMHAAAAIVTKDHTLKEGKTFLMQFLSALAWAEQGKIEIVQWTNSSIQGLLNKYLRLPLTRRAGITQVFFRPTALPVPNEPKAQLALALFREGLSLNHEGYSFLSYYKIINLRYPNDNKQKRFIKRSLPLIENLHHLKDILKHMKAQYPDLVAYIYEACRCAVAHASIKKTTYNPENIEDIIRFYEVGSIAHALAKLIIENEFGIKSTFTIIREHLYELDGFHQILGNKISETLKAGKTVPVSEVKFDSKISLRLWNKRKFKAFEKLKASVISCRHGELILSLSRDNILKIPLTLDFPKEKLIFDPTKCIDFNDDGTANAASLLADAFQFYSELMGNAVLEVWKTETNVILGRLLEYIPVHRDGQLPPYKIIENCKTQAKLWQQEAKKRKLTSST